MSEIQQPIPGGYVQRLRAWPQPILDCDGNPRRPVLPPLAVHVAPLAPVVKPDAKTEPAETVAKPKPKGKGRK